MEIVHLPAQVNGTTQPASKPFIEANTIESTLREIRSKHIIPVFIKDNEPVISHAEFIDTTFDVLQKVYPGETYSDAGIRLSHPIKGRIPEAKHKSASELEEWEKTLYFERMAFIIEIPTISDAVGGNILSLTVGGVKAYNLDNLYNRKGADEHFKLFVGFQNKVCTNLCIWTDGYAADVRVRNAKQLQAAIYNLLISYDAVLQLKQMEALAGSYITEDQFAYLIGRCRMYHHLPTSMKDTIPEITMGDSQLRAVVRDYYKDESFCRMDDGSLNLWRLLNLFTGANKSSYIDQFIDRSVNAFTFISQIHTAIRDRQANWYIK